MLLLLSRVVSEPCLHCSIDSHEIEMSSLARSFGSNAGMLQIGNKSIIITNNGGCV